jgi:hypothetical protein
MTEVADSIRAALEQLIDKLEDVEDSSIATAAASVAAWRTVHDVEAFISSAKIEMSVDVSDGNVSQETVAYALRWLGRAHKSATKSAETAEAKKNEIVGSLSVLKWATQVVSEALASSEMSLGRGERPQTFDSIVADIKLRKEKSSVNK